MERQVGRKDIRFIRGNDDVVGTCILREHGDLLLHENMAGVGAPRSAGILELAFFGDPRAELAGRGAVGVGEQAVRGIAARDQKPLRPLLPHRELGNGIGEHCAARRDVQNVRAAHLAAQRRVARGGVQDQDTVARRVGEAQQIVLPCHDHDQIHAVGKKLRERGIGLRWSHRRGFEREGVAKELAGRHVVFLGKLGPREPHVLGNEVVARDRSERRIVDPEHRDAHVDGPRSALPQGM